MADQEQTASDDIFSRPSGFRQDVIAAVWDRAERGSKPDTRLDWRTGEEVGPWKEGESRDGVWDMGHKEAWYKVTERLKKRPGVTRDDVLDAFNDLNNLGVENPETNRKLGVNSRMMGHDRLDGVLEEEVLFQHIGEPDKERRIGEFREQRETARMGLDTHLETIDARHQGEMRMAKKETGAEEAQAVERPNRVIIWDTETTGLSPKAGDSRNHNHRLVEIAAVEMIDGELTGRKFHQYINPERSIPRSATRVHGISSKDVKDAPTFDEIADDFLEFVGDAPLVAHNASFDMRFLNFQLEDTGRKPIPMNRKIDSLRLARKTLPDLEKHTLDILADHFNVDRSAREDHHGGMIDTVILAGVYKELEELAIQEGLPLVSEKDQKAAASAKARQSDEVVSLDYEPFDQVAADQQELWEARLERYENKVAPLRSNPKAQAALTSFADRILNEAASRNTSQGIG